MLCLFNLHSDLALVQVWYQGTIVPGANFRGDFLQIRCHTPPFLKLTLQALLVQEINMYAASAAMPVPADLQNNDSRCCLVPYLIGWYRTNVDFVHSHGCSCEKVSMFTRPGSTTTCLDCMQMRTSSTGPLFSFT